VGTFIGVVGLEAALTIWNDQMALLPWGLSRILGLTVYLEIPAETVWYAVAFGAVLVVAAAVIALPRRRAAVAALLTLGVVLSGCAAVPSQEVLGSRATLYDSVEQLADDSSVAVVGTVTEQRDWGSSGTLSVLTGEGFEVLQYGSDVVSSSAPILEIGETYLLFLSEDDPQNGFFVTGVSAGIYRQAADGYHWLGVDDDNLPTVITEDEAAALLR